jgi:hypothetical protein
MSVEGLEDRPQVQHVDEESPLTKSPSSASEMYEALMKLVQSVDEEKVTYTPPPLDDPHLDSWRHAEESSNWAAALNEEALAKLTPDEKAGYIRELAVILKHQ